MYEYINVPQRPLNLIMLVRALILTIISAMLFSACSQFLHPIQFTKTEPNKKSLIGIWIPDRSTIEYMREEGGYNTETVTKLILETDGTFEMYNMPDWWYNGFGQSNKGFRSYSGTWKLFQQPSSNIWVIHLVSEGQIRPVNLLNQEPPYQLYFYIGDPDSRKGMTFIKSS